MSAEYELNAKEAEVLGIRLLRVNGIPEDAPELEHHAWQNKADLIRWKFPASYTNFNHLIMKNHWKAEFSGAVRHLVLEDTKKPGIKSLNNTTFQRYTGSSQDRASLRLLLETCYMDDALGMRPCPTASSLVDRHQQLTSLQSYFEENFVPESFPDNHFYFALLNNKAVGFCALSFTSEVMTCPLGGVHPDFAGQGIFSDILLFSRTLALDEGIPRIHMGIRASNNISMRVFLKHTYQDTGQVIEDYVDYVFFLIPYSH